MSTVKTSRRRASTKGPLGTSPDVHQPEKPSLSHIENLADEYLVGRYEASARIAAAMRAFTPASEPSKRKKQKFSEIYEARLKESKEAFDSVSESSHVPKSFAISLPILLEGRKDAPVGARLEYDEDAKQWSFAEGGEGSARLVLKFTGVAYVAPGDTKSATFLVNLPRSEFRLAVPESSLQLVHRPSSPGLLQKWYRRTLLAGPLDSARTAPASDARAVSEGENDA